MSVKALRALIDQAGLASDDCLEKAELRARAREAADHLHAQTPEAAQAARTGTGTEGPE